MVTITTLKNLSITCTTLEHTYIGPLVCGIHGAKPGFNGPKKLVPILADLCTGMLTYSHTNVCI